MNEGAGFLNMIVAPAVVAQLSLEPRRVVDAQESSLLVKLA